MLCHSDRPLLKTAALIAFEHHERWDGTGYPRYLKEEEISIEGRITAIADVFDALGSDRVYKQAWKDEDIFNYLRNESGKQFDPSLIKIFFEHINEFLEIRRKFSDI
jgi:response regulator RpfG family c-di-GMP phosphodiesterase